VPRVALHATEGQSSRRYSFYDATRLINADNTGAPEANIDVAKNGGRALRAKGAREFIDARHRVNDDCEVADLSEVACSRGEIEADQGRGQKNGGTPSVVDQMGHHGFSFGEFGESETRSACA
jgi:hypothetical protein